MSKPLNQYVRVPFRGTHYVEAAALDSAIAQISALEKKLGTQPETQAEAAPDIDLDASEVNYEADAAQEKALEDLIQKVGGSLQDGETGPVEILAYLNKLDAFSVDQQKKIADLHTQEQSGVREMETMLETVKTANDGIAGLKEEIATLKDQLAAAQMTIDALKVTEPGASTTSTVAGSIEGGTAGEGSAS